MLRASNINLVKNDLEFEDNQVKINEERRKVINDEKEDALNKISAENGTEMINTTGRNADPHNLFVSRALFVKLYYFLGLGS